MIADLLALAKPYVGQAVGAFSFMLSEAVLGKTRFGSWLGLAKAVIWFIVRTIIEGIAKVARPIKIQEMNRMSGTLGVQSVLAVVTIGLDLYLLGKDVAKDGVSATDLGLVLSSSPKLIQEGAAAYAAIGSVIPELKDLQQDEAEAVLKLVEDKLGVTDSSKAARIANKALKVGFDVYDLVLEIQS